LNRVPLDERDAGPQERYQHNFAKPRFIKTAVKQPVQRERAQGRPYPYYKILIAA
jgi:hypothetical protein